MARQTKGVPVKGRADAPLARLRTRGAPATPRPRHGPAPREILDVAAAERRCRGDHGHGSAAAARLSRSQDASGATGAPQLSHQVPRAPTILTITDLRMPGLNGPALYEALRATRTSAAF